MTAQNSHRAVSLVGEIDQLVTLPTIYFEIRRIIESPSSSIIDAAKAISMDVALTAKLLRIVNSPVYAQSRPVETVTRAVSMLGMNQIHDLCLAASLASAFSNIQPSLMDVERFWRDSLRRANCSRSLAKECGILDRERLFILGLLCDIGHLVMYLSIPEATSKLLLLRETSIEPLHLIEQRHLECDYAQVGAALLRRWGLPASLSLPVETHTNPRPGQAHALEAALLNLVVGAMHARAVKAEISTLTSVHAWEITGLTPEQVVQTLENGLTDMDPLVALFTEKQVA